MATTKEIVFRLPDLAGRCAVFTRDPDASLYGWRLDVYFCDILVVSQTYSDRPGVRADAESDAGYLLRGQAPRYLAASGITFEDMRLDR